MNLRRGLALSATITAAAALAGCSTVARINPFQNRSPSNTDASIDKSKRVALLALDENLKPNEALKGIEFFLPAAKPQTEWPLPGATAEQSVEHVEAAPAFQVAWRRKFGTGSDRRHHVTASPVAAGGKIFVMDGAASVSAIDAASGRTVWRVNLDPRLRRDRSGFGGGLAVADGKLFVTSGYRFVAALDAASGREIWRQHTLAVVHNAPTVAGGRLFTVTTDNQVLTFDAATGRPDWKYQALIEPARILAASSVAVSGDTVVANFSSGELVALSTANGTELWNQQLTRSSRTTALSEIRDISGRPVVYRGDAFASSQSGVFASVDLRSGQLRWAPLPIGSLEPAWAAGDVVYVVSKAGEVVCVSRDNGQVYWLRDLNEGRKQVRKTTFGFNKVDRPFWSGPMLASNRIVTVSTEGVAQALNPRTGATLGTLKIPAPALITPIAANGMIYYVTDKAELVAIR